MAAAASGWASFSLIAVVDPIFESGFCFQLNIKDFLNFLTYMDILSSLAIDTNALLPVTVCFYKLPNNQRSSSYFD